MNTRVNSYSPSYQGNIVLTGHFSDISKQSISNACSDMENLIKHKDWNLYIRENSLSNEVNMICDYTYPFAKKNGEFTQINLPVISKSYNYVNAAKKAIANYENIIKQKRQNLQKQDCHEQDFHEDMGIIFTAILLLPPLIMLGAAFEGINQVKNFLKNTVNKAKKLAIKKG